MRIIVPPLCYTKVVLNYTEKIVLCDYLVERIGLKYEDAVEALADAHYDPEHVPYNLHGDVIELGGAHAVRLSTLKEYFLSRGLFNGKFYRHKRKQS